MKKKMRRPVSILVAILLLALVYLSVPAFAADADLEVIKKEPSDRLLEIATFRMNNYPVHVFGGTGSGNYNVDSIVDIIADPVPASMHFKEWQATGVILPSPNNAVTSFRMPDNPVTLIAVYEANIHNVVVNGSSGSNIYSVGDIVNLTADLPAGGMHFKEWQTTDVTLPDPFAAAITFVMPDYEVTLTAVYEANRHNVVVNGSSGSNIYSVGDIVSLTVDPPAGGTRFKKWQTTDITLPDPSAAAITFVMPDHEVNLTAIYVKRPAANPSTTNASLNRQSAAFDRNPESEGYEDVSVTFSSGSHSLSEIRMRDALLIAGKDYNVSGSNYTFTKEFLSGLSEGEHNITFDMSGGRNPVLAITVTDFTEVWSNPFTDVRSGDWFYEDVKYVHQKGLFLGINETGFSPETPVTRAMAVTVLGRSAGIEPSSYQSSAFDDVEQNAYFAPFVAWAKEQGIVNGIEEHLFAPDDLITREDLSVMLFRYANAMGITLDETREYGGFADHQRIHPYAGGAVNKLYCAGVINGKPGNLFDSRGSATRAETAAMLHRLLQPR